MADVVNIDWLNENAYRNYPLVDGASRLSGGGAVLPRGLFTDLTLPVPLGTLDPARAFIRKVYGFSAGVVITIGNSADPTRDYATATFFTADATRNKSYPLVGIPGTPLEGVTGRITAGLPEAVAQCSMGFYDFSAQPANTALVVSCIRPLLQGVKGVVVQGANGVVSPVLGGVITFVEGPGVTLTADPSTGKVTIAAAVTVTPDELIAAGCGCDQAIAPTATPITSINGVRPDSAGNFTLQPTNGIQLNPIANGLQIVDGNTVPCCDCSQLQQLLASLQEIENAKGSMQQVADQLQARVSNLANVVAAAGLNPPSTPPAAVDPACWWWLPIGFDGGGAVVPCPS
jgi:hypothetical protein